MKNLNFDVLKHVVNEILSAGISKDVTEARRTLNSLNLTSPMHLTGDLRFLEWARLMSVIQRILQTEIL